MLLRESVIENWVVALCNLAINEKKEREYIEQTNVIVEVLKDQDEFEHILNAHIEVLAKKIDKNKIIDKVFTDFDFDPYLINTMKILAREFAFEYARPIFKGVRKRLLHDFDQEYGVIWSTIKLKKADISKIEKKLSHKLNFQVNLVNKIDPLLIGGVQVIVANQIFDLSIKGQLEQIKLQTLETKIK